jgi:trimethylamine--corrinoid protein Co-methyltransferase
MDIPSRFPGQAGMSGFSPDDLEQMHAGALRVLSELGLAVENQAPLQALAHAGVRVEGKRAFFEPQFVEEHLQAMRAQWAEQGGGGGAKAERLTFSVGDMCQHYHNPHNDAIELMSTRNVIEAAKCVQVMGERGLGSYVPGVPRDVPAQLQALVEYRIGAEFLPGSPTLDTLHPPEALPFLFEMAEAMGSPLRATNVFSVSPLRLAGYEFDIAIAYRDQWDEYSVTTYPAAGVSAPIHFRAAWVLSIAEALGGAVTMRIAGGGKPVSFSIGMFPFDLRTLTIVGGMPECAWMYWARGQIDRFYNPQAGYSMMLGTQAKRPGLQAGYEKGVAGTVGALTGCDDLHYVGVLSFDDIFSPEQMVADIELCDLLEHLRRGIPRDDPQQWVAVIREGLERGYMQADTTLDHYREAYWTPRLLDRLSWHTFQQTGGKTARQRSRAELLSRLQAYRYRPPAERIERVRAIFQQAWKHLGGDPRSEVLPLLCNGN